MTFSTPIRVRWNEADPQGVVFNANYLIYADVAGTDYFRQLGASTSTVEDFLQLYVVDAHLAFKSPAKPDDLITCHVTPTRIGNSSLQLTIRISREDTELTEITLTYVRAINGKSTPLSDSFRALLTA
ncbi:acyl-CoA thioesterase [Brevundimonas pishanensis]|uniref:acyl-CoA thioesterase n=1 Tax=Brevundimonas pishanensis TaxID=2896315 RepID=UPI001FA72D15|nr:thioesterase family protein [Brevundimonas pishanensis]